ncbi:LIC_13246 family protein [Leptospira santarosai]|uniref:LIC_13246 family protein n=1 Tax=Leptospira santarosai TaxID=28183 RepID=UPI000774A6AF
MNNGVWKEIDSIGKTKFNEILRVLNNFYDSMVKNKTRDFKFLLPQVQNTKIYLQKLDDYSYLIFAEIIESESTMRENWIHIDGIKEEQVHFTSLGITDVKS